MYDKRLKVTVSGDNWSVNIHNTESRRVFKNIFDLKPFFESGFMAAKIQRHNLKLTPDDLQLHGFIHEPHSFIGDVPYQHMAVSISTKNTILCILETRLSMDTFTDSAAGEDDDILKYDE